MRHTTKDIEIIIDGTVTGFRLSGPDAFSGVLMPDAAEMIRRRRINETRADAAARAGYIAFSPDRVPEALRQLYGYKRG